MKIRLLFCICLVFISAVATAQFTAVRIGVDGLTCSQCSRSVEMRLRKLDFIKEVQMDLANTRAVLKLKPNAPIAFSQVAKAVTDAGFSVRFIDADFKPGAGEQLQASCFTYKNACYELAKGDLSASVPVWKMRFVDKGMIDPVSYKKYHNLPAKADCHCKAVYRFVLAD
ncbi:heavy-metal-associated domain-containing protein [Edaphocola aurantiacus]|uniref:heavy-metal-associated domain-containing protein n=1 Tax=Edaphocola aurantiacus TaxID=2601682 RepID=UPI001C93C0BB|nr:heavy metal-associated domain-containing protein [Edaphocola aurantiacus]